MTGPQRERRLAAILAVDVAGYSRMMGSDEAGTLDAVNALWRDIARPLALRHHGRIVKLMGDGALLEFGSVVDAIDCAVAIQEAAATVRSQTPAWREMSLRIGVNVGDIIAENDDIYGDGVNLAARLQEIAPPDGIMASAAAWDHAGSRVAVEFLDGGQRTLKNIARPVHVYVWAGQSESGPASRTTRPRSIALPDKPSIVVLPFDNMSGDPGQDYFADGVVEAITAALSRIRSFFVIARNSAFVYKGRSVDVKDIGRELGVAYLLEGSVQKAGGRVRITVQLIDTQSGVHLWADRYDGALDDIFDLQDRITENVAGAMQPSIRFAEIERARRKPPSEAGAYDYTMRALRHVWMLEKAEADRGLQLLGQALELDPEYPLALALSAWCWAQRSVYNWVAEADEAQRKSLEFAEKAASLSSDDPLILAVLGTAHTFARNFGTARILLERANALDPNGAWALSRLGWLEVYADRPEAAQPLFERALRLSPLDPMNFNNYVGLASASQVAGDDAAAAELFLRALRERPNAAWVHRNLAAALLGAGRREEAERSRDALLAAYPQFTVTRFCKAMVFSPHVLDRIGDQLLELGIPA